MAGTTITGDIDRLERIWADGDAVAEAARRIDADGVVERAADRGASGRETVTGVDPDARAPIPDGHRFQGRDGRQKDFAEGRDIQDIADALIEARECFGFLADVLIRYRWRRKAQAKAGKATLGYCQKLSGQLRDEMGGGEFQIVLNAEHCRDFQLTNWQLEALVAHELAHISPPDPDDPDSEPTLVGHDVEAFTSEIESYGLWRADLKRAAPAFVQASLGGL